MPHREKFILLTDLPLGEKAGGGNPLEKDRLAFAPTARILARASLDAEGPLTIGIYGPGGSGKTSLLYLIQAVLETAPEKPVCVRFNAWKKDREKNLIMPLLSRIYMTFDQYEKSAQEEIIAKYSNGFPLLKNALRSLLTHLLNTPTETEGGPFSGTGPPDFENYSPAREELGWVAGNEELAKPGIIVLIDDLDRCPPSRQEDILKVITFLLNHPGFCFILALTPPDPETGKEKIFQLLQNAVQVRVPVPEPGGETMDRFIKESMEKGCGFPRNLFGDPPNNPAAIIKKVCGNNPRDAIRLINTLLVMNRIAEEEKTSFDPEVILKWLHELEKKPAGPLPPSPEKETSIEVDELDREEIKRMVTEEGIDPLNIVGIREEIKTKGILPEFAKSHVHNLDPLKKLATLTSLSLKNCTAVSDLKPLWSLTKLNRLDLSGCTGITSLKPLWGLTEMEWLELSGCTGITDLNPLRGMTLIKRLYLGGCMHLCELGPLRGMTFMEWLDLTGCTKITDLKPLGQMTTIEYLDLTGCTGISNLSPLRGLKSLVQIYLTGCTGVTDLAPLGGLTSIKRLFLKDCTRVTDLKPLENMKAMKTVDLTGCKGVKDITPLFGIPDLKRIRIRGSGVDRKSIPPELQDKITG